MNPRTRTRPDCWDCRHPFSEHRSYGCRERECDCDRYRTPWMVRREKARGK